MPDDDWGFDEPDIVDSLQWYDGAPNLTEDLPFLWRASRNVFGQPAIGAGVEALFSAPVIVGRYGLDGQPGLDGVAGADGTDGVPGEDGRAHEYVFARTGSATLSTSQRPSNTWGYDDPESIGGLQWYDGAPTLTASLEYLWRAERVVEGAPNVGASVPASWTNFSIVGRYGVDGQPGLDGVQGADGTDGVPGEDGRAHEYVFARTGSATLSTSQRPSNTWGYDDPESIGGLQWYDGAPTLTASLEYLWRAERVVEGAPNVGASVPASWTNFSIVGRYGVDGQPGLDGVQGADGTDGVPGEDGRAHEYVFARTGSATLSTSQRPSNTWGYDDPESIGGLQWYDGAPTLTASLEYLWRAERVVEGAPNVGASVPASWTNFSIVGRYGVDGQPGLDGVAGADGTDGVPGEDGRAHEYVFARTGSATLSTSQRPSNTWGYDDPESIGGLQWYDGAPTLTASLEYLWRAERVVEGAPNVGASVPASWTNFSIVGRYGVDGQPGLDGVQGADGTDGVPGEDGRAHEYVFARTSSATLSTSQRPSNTWGYDNPTFAGGLLWNDGAPNLTASTSYLWRAERTVDGVPAFNSQISASWTNFSIVGRYGVDGQPGLDGVEGADGTDGVTGEDGRAREYVFARTGSATLPTSQRPSNTWGYDDPESIGGLQWYDGART